jgi:outer membrane protein, heavy metal efflux system
MARHSWHRTRAPVWQHVLTVALGLVGGLSVQAQEPPAAPKLPVVTLQAALAFALENNPALTVQRKQLGVASARVVIADLYPFNPTIETRVQQASGPESAGITNRVPVEQFLFLELELRHQRTIRRQGAAAGFSRTEWEIAFQEQTVAADVKRAYAALLYRQQKLRLLEETLRLNEQLVGNIRRLIDLGKLKSADLVLAQTEVIDLRDQIGAGREAEAAARQDLLRALGATAAAFEVEGPLSPPSRAWDAAALTDWALTRRADVRARQMAVAEAAANARLVTANRYGNPSVGTVFSYDPSRVSMIGVQVNFPIPVLNDRRGEIAQSEAERAVALAQLQQTEVVVKQDVAAALARLAAAERRAEQTRTQNLPAFQRAVEDMEKLFEAGEPGVDALRVIDVRRKLLRARDGYLDAQWSVRQSRIDLAAATGEPALDLAEPARPPVSTHAK